MSPTSAPQADVTVSVWNRFWSFELVNGLVNAGYRVQYVGTTRRRTAAQAHYTCWAASCLTLASHLVSRCGWGEGPSARLREAALPVFERYASRYAARGRCFWAWNGHNLAGCRRAKEAGIPVVVETGSTHALWQQERLESEYGKHGIAWSPADRERIETARQEYELADRIVAPSRFVERTFLEEGVDRAKLSVNPFGVDASFWKIERQAPSGRPFTVVYAAALTLRKGIEYLIAAWKRAALKDARLLLVGGAGGDARPLVATLPGNVTWLGFQTHGVLRETYRDCDLYVLPSLEEGMARSVIEAMAAGLPVVVTEETGMTDVMVDSEDGFVVPAMNADVLAQALRKAAGDRARLVEMGRSAQRRVAGYTWAAYGRRGAEILRTIIGPPRPVTDVREVLS